MHTFLIASQSKEDQENEIKKILAPYTIHPLDITRVTPQPSIGIAQIREIKQKIALKPFQSRAKALIIPDAQTATIEAQNALLKTLEEPPNNTIIILLTTNANLLLPTIISRCQVIQLPINNKQLTTGEISILISELEVLTTGKIGDKLALAEKIAKDKETILAWLFQMILFLRQKLLKHFSDMNHHSEKQPTGQYLTLLKSLQNTYTFLSTTNVNPRLTLETLFLSFLKEKETSNFSNTTKY